jgi:NAD+ kinase
MQLGSKKHMKNIGVIINLDKPGTRELLPVLREKALQAGLHLVYDHTCSEVVTDKTCESCDSFFGQVDAVITLGGDGTLLGAVRRMMPRPVPILGINFGKLGFLTSVTQDRLDEALTAMAQDTLIRSRRQLLECTYANPGEETQTVHALNDVVLSWGKSSHIATLDVSVNQKSVTTYTCDGLIVSTPTGSTGHSLSAGGPILTPETEALILNPICPHAMTVRPVVMALNTELSIRLADQSKSLVLACDGQPLLDMKPGGVVCTRPGKIDVELLQLPDYHYWEVLRNKLHWRGSSIPA